MRRNRKKGHVSFLLIAPPFPISMPMGPREEDAMQRKPNANTNANSNANVTRCIAAHSNATQCTMVRGLREAQCDAIQCKANAMQCNTMQRNTMQRNTMRCDCNAMQCNADDKTIATQRYSNAMKMQCDANARPMQCQCAANAMAI